jgi:hypothetical protein
MIETRTQTHPLIRSAAAGLLALALVGTGAGAATAKGGNDREVRSSGRCSAGAVWKLKAKPDDGRLEVELEIDSNRNGQRWAVAIGDNGVRVFTGTRRTHAPSGSFEVERKIANRAGRDRISASARNARTGQRCAAVVVY